MPYSERRYFMKIIHVIPNLNVGGAETIKKNLVNEQQKHKNDVLVVNFYEKNSLIHH